MVIVPLESLVDAVEQSLLSEADNSYSEDSWFSELGYFYSDSDNARLRLSLVVERGYGGRLWLKYRWELRGEPVEFFDSFRDCHPLSSVEGLASLLSAVSSEITVAKFSPTEWAISTAFVSSDLTAYTYKIRFVGSVEVADALHGFADKFLSKFYRCDRCYRWHLRDGGEARLDNDVYCPSCAEEWLVSCERCGTTMDRYGASNVRGIGNLCGACLDAAFRDGELDLCRCCGRAAVISELSEHRCCSLCEMERARETYESGVFSWNYQPRGLQLLKADGELDSYFGEPYCVGIEQEVEPNHAVSVPSAEFYWNLSDALREIEDVSRDHRVCYPMHDGSLCEGGFEVTSCVVEHEAVMNGAYPLERLYEIFRSHDLSETESTGMHVHVSPESFGHGVEERDYNFLKTSILVNRFYDCLCRLTNRSEQYATEYAPKLGHNVMSAIMGDSSKRRAKRVCKESSSDHYNALALSNKGTAEFRLFGGATKPEDVRFRVDTAVSLVKIARLLTVDSCSSVGLDDLPVLFTIVGADEETVKRFEEEANRIVKIYF